MRLIVLGIFVGGMATAAFLLRRNLRKLVAQAVPYVRQRATVSRPALIINPWSGDGKAAAVGLTEAAEQAGVRTIVLQKGDDLAQLAEDAIADGADAIGMAGGDGSLGVVAAVAIARNVPFFCIPVGTRNHFALDLGLDRDDPLTALRAISDGDEILVDHAVAGDRAFLNNVSFGVYAQAIQEDGYREHKEDSLAKVLAEVAADPANQAALRYSTPDGKQHDRAPLVLISNNPYTFSGPPDFGRRTRMDSGQLGIKAVTRLPEVAGAAAALFGETHDHYEWDAVEYRIESDDPILAGLDGEALTFASPLVISSRPKSLRMLVPHGTRPGYVPHGEAITARLLDLANLGAASDGE